MLGVALPEERAQQGWTEGVAIWVAVIIVSFVGEHISRAHCRLLEGVGNHAPEAPLPRHFSTVAAL